MRPRRSQTLAALFVATGLALVSGCGSTTASETTPNPAAQVNTAVAVPAPQSTVAVPAPGSTNDITSASPLASPTSSATSSAPAAAGAYVSWADYEKNSAAAKGKVVLFFHAGWCPTCQEAERNLTSEPVPAGLTIVKVDYDNSNDLRQKYGVTLQHTFVQVDTAGAQLAKWSGSNDAAAILGKTV